MAAERVLNLYLPAHLRADHAAGNVNILSQLIAALPGWELIHRPEEEGAAQPHPGFALTHMQEPLSPQALCLRRAYWYPFWRIEATNERWNFAVAQAVPALADVPKIRARNLHQRLRERVLQGRQITQEGFVFMPLQGRLLQHRSFQSCSPVAMIETSLARDLRVVATLHPGESYSLAERAALDRLAEDPRFTLADAPAADLLSRCDFVVSQNSSLALQAMIAGKGAVLFAGIDFHHPAGSVPRDGLEAAFAKGAEPPQRMAEYLWWFLKVRAIDAQAPDAAAQIRAVLRGQGWPVE